MKPTDDNYWAFTLWRVVLAGCYERDTIGIATPQDKALIAEWEKAGFSHATVQGPDQRPDDNR